MRVRDEFRRDRRRCCPVQYCPIKKTGCMAMFGLMAIFVGCQGASFAGNKTSDSPVSNQTPSERPAEPEPIAEEPAEAPVSIAGANLLAICDEAGRVELRVEIGCILRNREQPAEKLSNIDWNYDAGQEVPGSDVEVILTPDRDDFDVIYRLSALNAKGLKTLLSRFRISVAYDGVEIVPEMRVPEGLSTEDSKDYEKIGKKEVAKSKNPNAADD